MRLGGVRGRPPVGVNNARFTNNNRLCSSGVAVVSPARLDVSSPLMNDGGRVCAMRVDPEIAFIYDAI